MGNGNSKLIGRKFNMIEVSSGRGFKSNRARDMIIRARRKRDRYIRRFKRVVR